MFFVCALIILLRVDKLNSFKGDKKMKTVKLLTAHLIGIFGLVVSVMIILICATHYSINPLASIFGICLFTLILVCTFYVYNDAINQIKENENNC